MATYKTRAIILSSYPYREHDKIVSFYSYDYGRLEARARGSRKILSKLAGHLEPFLEVELLLANGRHWDILAGSRTIDSRLALRRDYQWLAAASICAEAVKLITRPLSRDWRVYKLLAEAFDRLERSGQTPGAGAMIAANFLWRLLALEGFAPELDKCINCRQGLAGTAFFSCEGGGVLCRQCRNKDPLAFSLDSNLLLELRQYNISSFPQLQDLVVSFWRRIVDYSELKSWAFIKLL